MHSFLYNQPRTCMNLILLFQYFVIRVMINFDIFLFLRH